MQTGIKELNGYKYYFDKSGAMRTGWVKDNNEYYYFGQDGSMRTGWINDGWADYFLKKDGTIYKGFLDDGLNKYFMDDNGQMKKGWVNYNGEYYYFGQDGAMRTGWINDGWTDYYLNKDGKIHNGFLDDGLNKYLLDENGQVKKGWINYNGEYYFSNENGTLNTSWKLIEDKWYYFSNDGIMYRDTEKDINGNIYKFDSDGVMITNKWFGATYVNKDGIVLKGVPSNSHSYTQYKILQYMSNEENRESVHKRAIELHDGETTNNCVYFTSEVLRRAGVKIPLYVANTHQLERALLSLGWKKSTDIRDLKPGDIVLSGYKHSFTFMNWYDDDYAYIVDNQKKYFHSVLHKRLVSIDDPVNDTIRATQFFYLPE